MLATEFRGSVMSLSARLVSAFVAGAVIAVVFYFSFHQLAYQWNWQAVGNYRESLVRGWFMTLRISVASLFLSSAIGVVFALVRRSRILPLRYFGQIYVELVRGTPLLV